MRALTPHHVSFVMRSPRFTSLDLHNHSVSNHLGASVAVLARSLSPTDPILGVASPFGRRLADASGRIEFTNVTDWSFTSSCFPPRLSTAQFPSVTDVERYVWKGLSPFCSSALTGARPPPSWRQSGHPGRPCGSGEQVARHAG